ncbi:MAG TPA: 4Fe-4S dicluster domain-containing protein [Terriglobia bacterium]|nr:4Fe-4S dicluster domain-containing protein [Terriglobia bacterium]
MSELVPIPIPLLLRRAFLEYEREGKIFDLPKAKFFRGLPGLDTSVRFHGHTASTPLGPAAGPHDQLVQNIVLSWLGGSRIIELKTVQILDELKIPRPCIDIINVGYNVEWSQELRLEQSLREYVGAAMIIEILKASKLLGQGFPEDGGHTIFDMSVGYDLKGISSPRVRAWMERMMDATAIVNELRATLTGPWACYRDLPFPTRISDTLTLSTFHGCPAGEIEGIVSFLLTEMDLNVCVKLNPTLLGKAHVEHLLHDVLGYHDLRVTQEAFDKDLQWVEAMEMIPRLDRLARSRGKRLAVKFSNTLVVKNHRTFFTDEVMYMSGAPLHVLTLNLVQKFRQHMGAAIPISFSAGLDSSNMANCVAMNFIPVTTCTDLLRPGGYARLVRYLEKLGEKMRAVGATTLPDFVLRHCGQSINAYQKVIKGIVDSLRGQFVGADQEQIGRVEEWLNSDILPPSIAYGASRHGLHNRDLCQQVIGKFEENASAFPPAMVDALRRALAGLEQAIVDAAGVLNTPILVKEATENPRYAWERNQGVPRKIGSKLWLYDCINCDKCVPVCPNVANFVYETTAVDVAYDNFELTREGPPQRIPGGVFKVAKAHQLANYADACNDCGNCDVFCPEDGGPYIEKPRFFSSLETYRKYAGRNGFYIALEGDQATIYGMIAGASYQLSLNPPIDRAWFSDGNAEVEIRPSSGEIVNWRPKPGSPPRYVLDMRPYLQLKLLVESIRDPRHVNFANVAGV